MDFEEELKDYLYNHKIFYISLGFILLLYYPILLFKKLKEKKFK